MIAPTKYTRFFKIAFILIFCLNFGYQKIVDNEANCGVIGSPESTCPYAFLDHSFGIPVDHDLADEGEHSDHVCISCPCNLQLSVSWDLNLSHIYIQLHRVYVSIQNPVLENLPEIKGYFRPPRFLLS